MNIAIVQNNFNAQVRLGNVDKSGMDYAYILQKWGKPIIHNTMYPTVTKFTVLKAFYRSINIQHVYSFLSMFVWI